MRTTLDIDEEILAAVKEIARREKSTAGKVISLYMRQVLTCSLPENNKTYSGHTSANEITGFRPFPSKGKLVTNDLIDRLRDEEGI